MRANRTSWLEHVVYNTNSFIQHVNIQKENRKLSRKGEIAFVGVLKSQHIYLDRVKIQFILTDKANRSKVRGNRKYVLSYKQ